MPSTATLAQSASNQTGIFVVVAIAVVLFILATLLVFFATRYRRCPSNRILVIWGRSGDRSATCYHGGGKFVWPIIQDYGYMSLEPLSIEIPLEGALSLNNIRVNVPSTFTVGISKSPVMMSNAAERLLGLGSQQIREQAQDIILGQLRLVIATLSIEEINTDREKFMSLINENVTQEINKVGLELINVNIRDITDESGYIVAIGQRAAAEAINRAKVEVAGQEREGAVGEAMAVRERNVRVAEEKALADKGQKAAEQLKRVEVARLEAEAIKGEVQSKRDQEIAAAERNAETISATKRAEQEQRIQVASAEALAVDGENTSSASVAESNARLAEIRAEAQRRSDVALAESRQKIFLAQREEELAKLSKELLAPQEIEKKRVEIEAEAGAERERREARGHADALLANYEAEAKGVQQVLEAKAEGYRKLVEACASNPQVAPTLLLIEQLPQLIAEQVKAISNLKIDKITVWDSGRGHDANGQATGRNATADFLAGMIGSLPQVHELAKQAGVELPGAFGRLTEGPASRVNGLDAVPGTKTGATPDGNLPNAKN
jgi:flotillin